MERHVGRAYPIHKLHHEGIFLPDKRLIGLFDKAKGYIQRIVPIFYSRQIPNRDKIYFSMKCIDKMLDILKTPQISLLLPLLIKS